MTSIRVPIGISLPYTDGLISIRKVFAHLSRSGITEPGEGRGL